MNTSLFLRQSYLDAWNDYQSSLKKYNFVHWDYVILTASNEEQAESYRGQIAQRLEQNQLAQNTHYFVLADPGGKRIGSGGATLNVLRYIFEHGNGLPSFEDKRILVIHSGGDSKRVPQYSACGKLFSPVPRLLGDGRRSTLFDEFIISMSGIPARMKNGMLVLSGDVLLVFNPLQIDFSFGGVSAVSIQEDADTGKNHGVYLGDGEGYVKNFLHKLSIDDMKRYGAVNEFGKVDIDTGAVLLSGEVLSDLFSVVCSNGRIDDEKWSSFVNEKVRLSFYGDFMYPMARNSTLEQYYAEKPEGEMCDELLQCRSIIWNTLEKHCIRLLNLSPAMFIHFGTTHELRELLTEKIEDYLFLDWKRKLIYNLDNSGGFACGNSFINKSAAVAANSYIEDSCISAKTVVGNGCVISNVILDDVNIPDNIVLHGMKLKNGKYIVRIYGTDDNPKSGLNEAAGYLNTTLHSFSGIVGSGYLWESEPHDLWNADLFPVCDSIEGAVTRALEIYDIANGDTSKLENWRKSQRMSLCSSFGFCDANASGEWKKELYDKIIVSNFIHYIKERKSAEDTVKTLGGGCLTERIVERLQSEAQCADSDVKIRIYYYLSVLMGSLKNRFREQEQLEGRCFKEIQREILADVFDGIVYRTDWRIAKAEETVYLPLRVNWGGGWSDTPPYCNENGGAVINAAIKVNGLMPVQVTVERLDEPCMVFESIDVGSRGRFDSIDELQSHSNPFDPFALHKSCLIACGVIPMSGGESLRDILSRLGGGIRLSTRVHGIPQGSGLGTSSILAGACVKAIFAFLGQSPEDKDLYSCVLCAEQIMSTGGGWQDQIGGMSPGIKFITTGKGFRQQFKVDTVCLTDETKRELQERFVLINTGQRRLARNLLRDVVGRYIGGNPTTVFALHKIQRIAALMRFELEKGNIDGFAGLLNEHWEMSKQLDENCTNTCIEQIFMSCEPLLDGKMICGAGGGGFLQVVLKRGVSKERLRQNIKSMFADSGVDVWDCEIVYR